MTPEQFIILEGRIRQELENMARLEAELASKLQHMKCWASVSNHSVAPPYALINGNKRFGKL